MPLLLPARPCARFAILPQRHAAALDYPTRNVHVIIPFTAGGAPDVLLRLVAQKLSEKWDHGRRGREPGRRQHRDRHRRRGQERAEGYALLAADQTFVLNPLLSQLAALFDEGVRPVVLMASIPHMLAVATRCRCRTSRS